MNGIILTLAAQLVLLWNASPDAATNYAVYYGGASGIYTNVVNVGNVLTATITNLPNSQRVYFAVTAQNAFGESDFSNEINVPIPPRPPGSLRWVTNSLQSATSPTGPWQTIATYATQVTTNGNQFLRAHLVATLADP